MTMTNLIVNAIQASVGERTAVWESKSHTVVATPLTLEDQTPITLYVTPVGDDLFSVSDEGLAAGALADAGVDLSRKALGDSFALIQKSLRSFAPSVDEHTGDWDIAVAVAAEQLGDALLDVSEAVIRAEALKAASAKRKPRNFNDRVAQTATRIGLRIEPSAPLPLKYGSARRKVSYRVYGDRRDVFLQTITRASTTNGYDHARSLFADASVEHGRLVAALEDAVRLETWQREGLSDVSHVVDEPALEAFLASYVAA